MKLHFQAAVLALKDGRVCIVTSRSGNHWVIPKGHVEPGETAAECALAEAFEEAGLRGTITGDPVTTYDYTKLGREYRVAVYLLKNPEIHDDWPERDERTREWVTPAVAMTRVRDAGLIALLARLEQ